MGTMSPEDTYEKVQHYIQEGFPNVQMEFSRRTYPEHLELVVYVLDVDQYEAVRERCDQVVEEMHLEDIDPEMWVMAREWHGPWPGGQSLEELQARREDFLRRHNMVLRPRCLAPEDQRNQIHAV